MSSPKSKTDTPADSEQATAPASDFLTPNAEGVFELPEKVGIGGLPVKCCGEFYLAAARHAQTGEAGFYVGYYLLMRQPANTAKQLPSVGMPFFAERGDALEWLVTEIAGKFFSDHKQAAARLAEWWSSYRAKHFPTAAAVTVAVEPAPLPPREEAPQPAASSPAAAVHSHLASIDVDAIEPNPENRGGVIDEEHIAELAESIRVQGFLLQPIAVSDRGEGTTDRPRYALIAGECRWRAHRLLGWREIEAKVFVGVDAARATELALIENLQRKNLNAMEEARGFAELRDRYGYEVAKIAERTGKKERTIYTALRLAALPAPVAALLRSGAMPPSQGQWLASARWIARPEHCAALAQWIADESVTVQQLGDGDTAHLPIAGARALADKKLAVDITGYRAHVPQETYRVHVRKGPGPDVVEAQDGSLWHLCPAQWREEKKEIDQQEEAKRKRDAARAAQRVNAAAAANVNVKVDDLTRANLAYARLDGAEARYLPHLPPEAIATGVDEKGGELVICLKPEALRKLKQKESELLMADMAEKLPKLHDRATARLAKLRKIGGRELAYLLDTSARTFADGKAFSRQRVTVPEVDCSRASLAALEPVDLCRVAIESTLLNSTGDELLAALRWTLEETLLGLAGETEEGREAILARAARDVFGVCDPKTLEQWQRAHAAGMAVAEIARSYSATVEDVCGALGIEQPAA